MEMGDESAQASSPISKILLSIDPGGSHETGDVEGRTQADK